MKDKDLVYKCLECNEIEVVRYNNHKIDGRVCKHCGGKLTPIRYVTGLDLAEGKDKTVYTPYKNIEK